MNPKRNILVIVMIVAAAVMSFVLPRTKYRSPDIISALDVPFSFSGWRSKDMSGQLDMRDQRYNFISDIFARVYVNKYGENLLCIILDAGNFHNPKACFGGAGYRGRELADMELNAEGKSFKAHSVFFSNKDGDGVLVVYWICINRKQVDWTRQKLLQLWYSLFDRQKVGVMIRLDIPTREERIGNSLELARRFTSDLAEKLSDEHRKYIFGE